MIIDESQEDRLHRIVYDVLGPEDFLNQGHVSFGAFFFLHGNHAIYVGYEAIILGQQYLPFDRPKPLIQVVLGFGCENIFPVLIFYFNTVFLSLVGALIDNLDGGII